MAFRGNPVVGAPAFATPTGAVHIGDAAVQGAGPAAASSQHVHSFPAPAGGYVTDIASLLNDGALTAAARADHQHRIQALLLAPGGAVDLSGIYARRSATTDGVQYVAVGGSDAADGLSWGGAKATVAAAIAALPAGGGRVHVGAGTFAGTFRLRSNLTLTLSPGTVLQAPAASNTYVIQAPAAGALGDCYIEGNGGLIDANAAGQTAASGGIQLAPTGAMSRVIVQGVRVLNAYQHGIFLTEGGGGSNGVKAILDCEVDGHGIGVTGFGIYVDYAPGARVQGNTVRNSANNSDAIELGHAGRYICTHNTVVDSQLQCPFASDSIIAFNLLLGARSVIQNDANTADRLIVAFNQIIGAAPDAATFGGISLVGSDLVIVGNHVTVSRYRGIRTLGANNIIEHNHITSTALVGSPANQAIVAESGNNSADVRIVGNIVKGNWTTGVVIEGDRSTVVLNRLEAITNGVYATDSSGSGQVMHNVLVRDNTFTGTATPIVRNNQTDGTNRYGPNSGVAPVGVANVTVGASPFTYTNVDGVDEAIYITGGTVSAVTKNGTAVFTASPASVLLAPGEAVTVTYTVAPTIRKDQK